MLRVLTSAHIWQIRRIISAIGDLTLDGHFWTDKGTDAAFLTEVEKDCCFLVDETDDIDRTLPNAHATSGAFVDINPGKHLDFSSLVSSFSV
jgi:hypothetical protein